MIMWKPVFLVGVLAGAGPAAGAELPDADRVFLIFKFESQPGYVGWRLADSVQGRLRRKVQTFVPGGYVASWLELENQLGKNRHELAARLPESLPQIAQKLAVTSRQELYVLSGQLTVVKNRAEAVANLFVYTDGASRQVWRKVFRARGERWKVTVSREIMAHVLMAADVAEPAPATRPALKWGASILHNGNFERGTTFPEGWAKPDGLCTFWVRPKPGQGHLMFDTHVQQAQALEWWKKLKAGADPRKAPKPIRTDPPHYGSVGGLYGASVYSDWLEIVPGRTFSMSAKVTGPMKGHAKVFVKGYALMPRAKSSKLQRREVWRAYLQCEPTRPTAKAYRREFTVPTTLPAAKWRTESGTDETFYPKVKWLRIMPYATWPVGKYTFDDIVLREGRKDRNNQ